MRRRIRRSFRGRPVRRRRVVRRGRRGMRRNSLRPGWVGYRL